MAKNKTNQWTGAKQLQPEPQAATEESDSQGTFEVEETTFPTAYTELETVATETSEADLSQTTERAFVRVLHDYGGIRTNKQRILPGVYDVNDPALFGLAEYLVINGHAEWVEVKG